MSGSSVILERPVGNGSAAGIGRNIGYDRMSRPMVAVPVSFRLQVGGGGIAECWGRWDK